MMPEMKDIQVVVMMGGVGSRLGSLVKEVPKPMLPVCGRPFFEYELMLLRAAGFKRFLFCTGYLSSEIEDHFKDGKDLGLSISYQKDGLDQNGDPLLLGTGGALRHALNGLDEDFLLVYADSFMDIDYREVVYRYFKGREKGALSLMTLLNNGGRFDKSNVIFRDGELKLYDKTSDDPEMDYIDYGVNMFSRSVFEARKDGEKFDLSEIQHKLSVEGKLLGLVVRRRFYEIGRPESYKEFSEYAAERFTKAKKAAFLDRDGVLNEIVFNEDTEQLDSPLRPDQLKLLEGAEEAVQTLKKEGYLVFVITNQPAAAKGKTGLGDLFDVNKKLTELMPQIDEVFMCPHHPVGNERAVEKNLIKKCDCRKPGTGLIEQACLKYSIDRSLSFMAGDSFTDVECGKRAGLKTVFIGDFKCDVCARLDHDKPDVVAKSLKEAVEVIIDE